MEHRSKAESSNQNVVEQIKRSLRTLGYKATIEKLNRLSKVQKYWVRENRLLEKALRRFGEEVGYDLYNLVLDLETSYTAVTSTSRMFDYKKHSPVTYTIGLDKYNYPEFLVSGDVETGHYYISLIGDYIEKSNTPIDLGEPLYLQEEMILFKRVSNRHWNRLGLLQWYNSFKPSEIIQILYRPFPWETLEREQVLYWTCPIKYTK